MALIFNTTVTGDANTDISWKPHRKEIALRGTIFVYGGGGNDFGNGTVTLQASPDGGTTFMDVTDQGGTAVTFGANGISNFELYANADPISGNQVQIRLALAGSTSPTIIYKVFDIT